MVAWVACRCFGHDEKGQILSNRNARAYESPIELGKWKLIADLESNLVVKDFRPSGGESRHYVRPNEDQVVSWAAEERRCFRTSCAPDDGVSCKHTQRL